MLPGRELTIYDQLLSALRVSYGHTDHWLEKKNSTQPALSNFPRFQLFKVNVVACSVTQVSLKRVRPTWPRPLRKGLKILNHISSSAV